MPTGHQDEIIRYPQNPAARRPKPPNPYAKLILERSVRRMPSHHQDTETNPTTLLDEIGNACLVNVSSGGEMGRLVPELAVVPVTPLRLTEQAE
ncbi:hypothetical protein ACIGBL_34830 [Streptomyces sp. NPDC085614]|uniref:hypothetical protein n=1 Tax=Streptomyces sp. NPDC085614 TaxID=3365733 RepID=UPI0037D66AC5